jgi:hypothetical protein
MIIIIKDHRDQTLFPHDSVVQPSNQKMQANTTKRLSVARRQDSGAHPSIQGLASNPATRSSV